MTIQYTVYDEKTGAILRTGTAMTVASAQLQGSAPGTRVVTVGSDPATEVVQITPVGTDPTKLPRLPMTVNGVQIGASKTALTANGSDSITISPIPNGATYDVVPPSDQGIAFIPQGVITDGSLIITTTVKGAYQATIKYGINLDFTVNFNAS